MSPFLSLALRNLSRSKARTGITLGAIFFGVLMTLLLSGFIQGLQDAFIRDAIETRVGALQIHRQGYGAARDNQPLALHLPAGGELEKTLRAIPGVRAVTTRLVFSGLVSNGINATPFIGQAIDPLHEYEVLTGAGAQGTTLPLNARTSGLVGSELAEALGAKRGTTLTVQASAPGGRENALDLDVAGTLETGSLLEAKRLIQVPLAYAQGLLGMEGRVTEYVVAVQDIDAVDETAERVRVALGPSYEVQTWRELRPSLNDIIRMQTAVLLVIAFVFLIIAVVGVVNTMSMSVMERTREIGTMLAVGVKRSQIGYLFLLEAATQAFAGGLLGALVASAVVRIVEATGGMQFALPGTSVPFTLIPAIPLTQFTLAIVASTTGAILAALLPSLRATRLRPVEALRAI